MTHTFHQIKQGMTLALMFALSAIGIAYAEPAATALPTGGQVVSGNAAIASTGATLNVNQNSQRAIVNWDSFHVGKDATVNFNQPNSGASTLNKIGGNSPSQVFGKINAPGEVILQNTAGVYFSPSAKVDVGALTATTHTISNDDYNNGNYHFDRNGSTGAVVNEGSIAAGLKGYVALLAPEVRNGGVIVAQMGSVVMASGERVTLNFDTSSHLASITTSAATINTLIENKSAVTVNGGQIILSAKALNALVAGVIKQSGTLDASNVATKFTSVGGRILIDGDNVTMSSGSQTLAKGSAAGGSVTITASKTLTTEATSVVNVSSVDAGQGGTITTTAPSTQLAGAMIANGGALSGKGGSVETNADTLVLAATATVNTANQDGVSAKGTWTVNLPSITVESNMAKVISSTLNTGNVALNAIASFFNLGQSQVIEKVSGDTTNLDITAKTDITLAGEINSDETAPLNLSLLGGQSIVMELLSTAKAASIAANAPTISAAGNLLAYGNSVDGSSLLMALIGARLSISGRVRASQNQTNDARILLSGSDEVAISATATINTSDENGGSIDVMSEDGQVTIAGSILTNGENGRGGSITVIANESIAISSTSLLANGTTDGGTVKIISSSDDVNAQNSIIQTNGGSGLGGTILISGLNNTLISNTTIQATGFTNGGTIKIGYDATNQTLPFSSFTNIDSASVINANQLDTSSYNVNGGYIETSGQTLAMLAAINAGRGGMWLLDPYDVTIAASGATGTTYSSSFTAGATTTILASAINDSLNAGTNVSITTGSSSANTIYVNSEILATTGSATLTLTGGTINLAANITTVGSQTYTGAVIINNAAGMTLTSTNSNITFSSTVNSVAGNYYGLKISNGSGTTAFGGVVGGTNALGYLCINATGCNASTVGTYSGTGSGTTNLAGNVTTSGNQTYAGALTLGANTVLTSTANGGNGAVTIAGNVNSNSTTGSGILQFLGSGNWKYSINGGSTWAYYSGNTYVAGSSSTTSAPSSLPFTISYSISTYTYTPTSSISGVQILVVGAGAAGGNSNAPATGGGGGGGVVYVPSATLSGVYSVLAGSGGAGASGGYGSAGGNSLFKLSTNPTGYQITANGGGGGAGAFGDSGAAGGSGGGGHWVTGNGGSATQGSVTGFSGATLSGNSGGASNRAGTAGGGGGGASAAGTAGSGSKVGGNGGEGISYSITGASVVYGSGGGGMGESGSGTSGTNAGNAGIYNGAGPGNGVVNTGGGGGAGFNTQGSGGSGVVVVSGAMQVIQGTYTLTINAGTGKATIGGTVSNISTLAINSKSALSAVSGAIGGATLVSYNTATGYTGSSGAAGVLSLAGTNTYTGGTTVTGGTLQAGSTTAFGASASGITVNTDAALDLNGKTLANTNALTLKGSGVSSGGALTNSSATGGTYVGAVTLGSDATIGSTAGAINVSGAIASSGSAYNLALVGTQAITLSSATNTLSTIASGSSLGALSITNNQALTIGSMTIGATTYSGLSSTGTILVKTITGNLTVSNSVVTTSTSSDTTTPAIKLSAGFSDATTSTTNNIILDSSFVGSIPTNAITAGTGAIIAMYSGSAASSTNLSVFTSGQSTYFTTYGVTTTTGSLATGAGYYALYRGTQPSLYVIFGSSDTPTYGTAPTITYTFNTLANGTGTSYLSSDTSIVNATGTALFKGTNTTTSVTNVSLSSSANAGSYGSVFYLSGLSSPVYTLSAGTTAGTLTINKANAYVMITSGQSSIYGATPTINYTFNTSSAGTGSTISSSPAGLTGTASITNAPTSSSDAGTYNLTYASGLSSTNYAFNGATSSVAYSVSPKPITISNSVSSTTYNGVRTYATLVSNAGFSTDVSLVGSDAIGSVTQATTISGNAVSGIAQAGSFVSTPSAAVLSTGSLSNYDFTYVAATNTVAKANLALTGTASTSGNIYNGNVQTSSYTTTFLGSDAASATIAGTVAQTNAGTYSSSLSVTGAILDNYNTPVITNASFVISPKPITYTTAAATGTYGTLSTLNTATFTGLVGSDDPGATVTAYSGATPVTLSATTNAGTYTQEVSALSNTNYAIASTGNTVGNLVISPLAITYTTTAATGTYGTLSTLSNATFAGLVGSDDPGATVTAYSGATPVTLATTTNAGTYTQEVSALSNGNYQLASTGHTIANLVISPLAITITGANNQVTYNHNAQTNSGGTFTIGSGSASPITSTNIPTGVGSQGFTLSGYGSGTNASVTPYADSLVMTANTGTQVSNYSVTLTNNGSGLTINKANLSATGTQDYNGTATIAGASLTVIGVGGETFSATGLADLTTKNVQTNQALANTNGLTITTDPNDLNPPSLDNYFPLSVSNTSVSITPLAVTLTAPSITKTYDGGYTYNMTAANLATMSGQLVGGDSVSAAEVLFTGNDANVGTSKSVRLNSATISDGNSGSNYTVTLADSSSSEVTAAVLTVSANNAAKFVTESDTPGFNGVVYTGFVNGETASSALSGTLTVTRTNASTNSAGNYTGVLIPGGLTANHGNYTITPLAGNLTITAADQLLVEITPAITSYGTAASYTATAKYLSCSVAGCPSSGSSNVIHTLSPVITGNDFSVSDGAGGSAAFTIIPVSATSSGAGYTNVGGYQLAAGTVTGSSSNFSNTIALTGALTVEPLTLTASQLGVSGVSKVYNGSNAISGLSLNTTAGSSTILSGDAVTVIGTGTYANANVGTSKSVTVAVGLTGADAGNYVLSTNQITDNIGTITQLASVTYTGTSGGNWSNASNWAGGAIPTLGNVATVIIPTDTTVVYDTSNLTTLTPTSAITDNGTISFTGVSPTTFANDVSGTGSIALSGLGAVTLTGTNTQSGGTSIASGASLIAGSATSLANNTLTSAGGNFAVANGVTLPSLTVNGAVTLGSDITTSGAQTYNGAVSLGGGTDTVDTYINTQTLKLITLSSDNADITFNGTLDAGVTSLADKRSLNVDAGTATVTFNDRVGAVNTTYGAFINRTADLSPYQLEVVAGTIIIKADITSFERQVYRGDVKIGDNGTNGLTRILLSEDPSIQFFGKVDDLVANTHTLKAMAVSIAGNEVPEIGFAQNVGSVAALAGLDVVLGRQNQDQTIAFSDTTISDPTQYIGELTIAGNVTTSGDQTYTANVIKVGDASVTSSSVPNAIQMTSTSGSVTFNTGVSGGVQGVGLNPSLEVLHGETGSVSGLTAATNLAVTSGLYNPPAPPAAAESNYAGAAFFASSVSQSVDRSFNNQLVDEVVEVGEVGMLENGAVKRLDGDVSCDQAAGQDCPAK